MGVTQPSLPGWLMSNCLAEPWEGCVSCNLVTACSSKHACVGAIISLCATAMTKNCRALNTKLYLLSTQACLSMYVSHKQEIGTDLYSGKLKLVAHLEPK